MNEGYVFVPIFGLASFVGVAGLLYFEWFERHQREWHIKLQMVRQGGHRRNASPIQANKDWQAASPVYPAQACQSLRLSTLPVDENPDRSSGSIIDIESDCYAYFQFFIRLSVGHL